MCQIPEITWRKQNKKIVFLFRSHCTRNFPITGPTSDQLHVDWNINL